MKYFLLYLLIISVLSVIVTVTDKICAIYQKWRVRERTLFILSALGGCVAMYLTMLLIRHKTKHKRFMIGLPIIILLQVVILWLILTQEFSF